MEPFTVRRMPVTTDGFGNPAARHSRTARTATTTRLSYVVTPTIKSIRLTAYVGVLFRCYDGVEKRRATQTAIAAPRTCVSPPHIQ